MGSENGSASGLRIALFSGNYNYLRDGANQALNRLVEYLEKMGASVRVYSPTGERAAFSHAGTLVSVPSIRVPGRNDYRLALGLPESVLMDLREFRPNLFHLSAPDYLGYQALRLARKWSLPAVASVHTRFESYFRYYGLAWLEGLAIKYLRHFYGQCEQIFAPTESMADILREQRMSGSIRKWGRGVDATLFSPAKRDMAWRNSLGIGDDEVVVAFVGRIVREKGLSIFADTIELLYQTIGSIRILVVGDGPDREWFEKRLPASHFTGFLQGRDLARAYASADIFFNPSTTETFGNVTLEAMASGCAVVCAPAAGSVSLVKSGVTGLIASQHIAEEYAGLMHKLVADPKLRAALSCAGRNFSLRLSWDATLREVLENYFEAASTYGIEKEAGETVSDKTLKFT